jgi:hypothetical protein
MIILFGGNEFSNSLQAQPDCWKDNVLEHVEAMLSHPGHHAMVSAIPDICKSLFDTVWAALQCPTVSLDHSAAAPSDASPTSLSPASANHLLLFEVR